MNRSRNLRPTPSLMTKAATSFIIAFLFMSAVSIRADRIDIGAFEAPGADLTIQLTLQGRPAAPNAAHVGTYHIEVRPSGGGAPVEVGDFVSNTNGQITLLDLPAGSYNVWVKGTHTLAVTQPITLTVGDNNLTTALLKEGDANGSNTITIADFSILAATFGKASGQVGYDARADFNGSGTITIADFSLLAGNFSQTGSV